MTTNVRSSVQSAERQALGVATSFLVVGLTRADALNAAMQSGADAVVLDLESSVPLAEKAAARVLLRQWLPVRPPAVPGVPRGPLLILRVNAPSTESGRDDLSRLSGLAGVDAVMIPRLECLSELSSVRRAFPAVPLIPTVGSVRGRQELPVLMTAPDVARVVMDGHGFAADAGLRCGLDYAELDFLRFDLCMHTRTAGWAPPIDGLSQPDTDDLRVRNAFARAQRYGFGGKLVAHARQVSALQRGTGLL